MFSSLTTKLAAKKLGIPSDALNFNPFSGPADPEPKPTRKLTKKNPGDASPIESDAAGTKWPAWTYARNFPLTAQVWLAPPPPAITVAEPPKVGDLAPIDRDRQLTVGGGKKVLVVFLRCVGCAFAQKTFLALRTIANRYAGAVQCIAVSHSSSSATQKWLDLLGGAWNVQIIIDEERAIYAAWGLGLHTVWHVFNPKTQAAGFKEKGWLGKTVATSVQRTNAVKGGLGAGGMEEEPEEGPGTVMGNKWQQAGAWALNGQGKVVWGVRAVAADDTLDLDAGVRALGF